MKHGFVLLYSYEFSHFSVFFSEVEGLLSDDFFRNCLCSEFGIIGNEDSETINDLNDNLRADEYYVILDKPYQYSEPEDDDQVMLTESVRIFNDLKRHAKQLDNCDIACYRHRNFLRFASFCEGEIVKVKVVVTVFNDFTVSIQVHDKKIPYDHEIWTYIPKVCYSISVLKRILSIIRSYNICLGNPDSNFQELIHGESSDLFKRQGCRDYYTGKSTILSTTCQLFCTGQRCKACQVYRGTLRKLLARNKKHDSVETHKLNRIHSRTPDSKLSESQRCHKLKQLKDYSKRLEKELLILRKKVSKENESKDAVLIEYEEQDIIQIMKSI